MERVLGWSALRPRGLDVRGPIETYLDKLVVELQGPGHEIRGILAEVEDHLTEAAAAGVAEGLDAQEAERRAVARFGSPRRLAHKFVPPDPARRPVLVELVLAVALLGGIGLFAIGLSGAAAAGLGAAFGQDFVALDVRPPSSRWASSPPSPPLGGRPWAGG